MERVFGLDLDGVICDFEVGIIEFLNEKKQLNIQESDITSWKFFKKFGITDPEFYRLFGEFIKNGWFKTLPPIKDAVQSVRYLVNNFTTYFITNRPVSAEPDTLKWFDIYLPTVDKSNIYHVNQKGQIAAELGVTHFVDDKAENIMEVRLAGVPNVYLFNRSHNADISLLGVPRVDGWRDFMNILGLPYDFMSSQ